MDTFGDLVETEKSIKDTYEIFITKKIILSYLPENSATVPKKFYSRRKFEFKRCIHGGLVKTITVRNRIFINGIGSYKKNQ
jgi:hypothetical protein